MKRSEKQSYLEDYDDDRRNGEPYFPRYALRDSLVGLALLLGLMAISAWRAATADDNNAPAGNATR